MDSRNQKIIQQHDWWKQKQNLFDGRLVQLVESFIWWQTLQGVRSENDPKTPGFALTERRGTQKGLALAQVLQTLAYQPIKQLQ